MSRPVSGKQVTVLAGKNEITGINGAVPVES
jgi:hypothetical protein